MGAPRTDSVCAERPWLFDNLSEVEKVAKSVLAKRTHGRCKHNAANDMGWKWGTATLPRARVEHSGVLLSRSAA